MSTRPRTGRQIARYWFPLEGDCQRCRDTPAVDRHHIDGNPLNNTAANIALLCRRCHMEVDGRIHGIPRPAKTHCKHGHEFTPDNTYTNPNSGKRSCKTCRLRTSREYETRRVRA
jgi:hypothetical protein